MNPNARTRQQLLAVLYAARAAKPDNGWVAVRDLNDAVGAGVDFGLAVLVELGQAVRDGYQQVVPVAPENVVQRSMSAGASSSFSLGTGVVPGSFIGSVPFAGGAINGPITIVDNGSGLLVAKGGQVIRTTDTAAAKDARIAGDQTIGTINYSTGACVINQVVLASS